MKKVKASVSFVADYGDGEVPIFNAGDELEVLKEVPNNLWLGGSYYVVYNPETNEAMTISSSLCTEVK